MSARQATFVIPPSPDSTISIEIKKAGLLKRKYFLVFTRFSGQLVYSEEDPLASALQLDIQTDGITCWEADRKTQGRTIPRRAADLKSLSDKIHGGVSFVSQQFSPKPLRGYVMEGILGIAGVSRTIRANVGFGAVKKNRLQIDADARLRLSDFGIEPPPSFLGLIRTEDEIFLQILVWGDLLPAER